MAQTRLSSISSWVLVGLLMVSGGHASGEDNTSAPPRWEVVPEKDGKFSVQTKEVVPSRGTITVQPVKLTGARWVNIGLRYDGEDHPNRPVQMGALDKPQVFRIDFNGLKGSILIYRVYGSPEKPK